MTASYFPDTEIEEEAEQKEIEVCEHSYQFVEQLSAREEDEYRELWQCHCGSSAF
jgi:hypothetical protein